MTAADEVVFAEKFIELRRAFQLRGDRGEVQQVMQVYFKALMRFPLRIVVAAADICIEKNDRFPKAAEWIRAMPRRESSVFLPMQEPDASEHRRAVSLHYQDEPCSCHECKRANVTHRMLRFVPEENSEGQDLRMLLDEKVVVKGHWAHGEELARWYVARDAYYAMKDEHPGKFPRRMKKPLSLVLTAGRESED